VASSSKARRPYRSALRERHRAATRAAVVDAATALFLEHGYAGASIARIAEASGVSPETVYSVFGTKRELLRETVRAAASSATGSEAVVGADLLERLRAEPRARRRLDLMAEATREVLRRVGPLDEVVRAAAIADPEIAELRREQEDQRLHDVRMLVKLLAAAGPLRVPERDAADLIWALSRSTDFYRALTVDRGWSDERAFRALNAAIARVVLPDDH
jgi:AcrR family transcriptional regulator